MSAFIRFCVANAVIAYYRHEALATFSSFSDAMLRDMGLERFDIERHVESSFPWQKLQVEGKTMLQPSIQGCG